MSPLTLAIDTSTRIGSIAIGRDDQLLSEVLIGINTRHAEALLPSMEFALGAASIGINDIDRIVVAAGPGSFTGLRIAAATVKGLVRALSVPLYAHSSLLALAANAGVTSDVCALLDARRNEVYAAVYRITDKIETVLEPMPRNIDAVLSGLDVATTTFVGEGAQKHAEAIATRGGLVLSANAGIPRASSLLWLMKKFPETGRVADPGRWEPAYLRESGAERGHA